MRKIVITVITLFIMTARVFAAAPATLSAAEPWPRKADWVGQQATVYPAKLYATASYLLVFPQPGLETSGADQLFFARTLAGKTFTIKGLFKLTKPAGVEYYWQLAGPSGKPAWVKDTADGPLALLPFALNSEIAAENAATADLAALAGTPVWINRNLVAAPDLTAAVGHLAPLTIAGFRSSGPFGDTYALTLRQEDGSQVVWSLGSTGARTAYSNRDFLSRVGKSFFRKNPQGLFPAWAETLWPLIRAREIRTGWDREMVLMSWGDPDTTEKVIEGPDKGLERWRYGGTNLYFRDKQLVKIKIPDPAMVNVKPAKDDKGKSAKGDGTIEVAKAGKNDDGKPADNKSEAKSPETK